MSLFKKNKNSNELKEVNPEQIASSKFFSKKQEKYEQLSLDSTENNIDVLENNPETNHNLKKEEQAQKKTTEKLVLNKIEEEPSTSSNLEKEQLEEAEEKVKNQNTKKKKWINFLMLVINIGVVAGILAYQLAGENMEVSSFGELIKNINWGIFFLIIVVFALLMFFETSKFWILTHKTCKTNRPALSYKVSAVGKYYDAITPLASGGQPFQIYYLTKRGVKGSDSVSICMGKYVIQQIAYIIFTLIIMILSIALSSTDTVGGTVVTASSWIGFSLNAFLIFIVAIISINKSVGNKIVLGVLKFFHKIKLVKNYDKQYTKIQKAVNDYQSTMKKYAKEKGTFFSIFGLSLLFLFLHYCIPFLIHASFYGFHFELFGQIFIYCVMVDLAASFFPLPGGTGASEISFTVLFGSLFGTGGNLIWALLIWRFFTYYIYILQGLFITLYDYLIGNKKFEWTKKRWALEAESREFEENELKEFELSIAKKNKTKNKKGVKKYDIRGN